MNPKTYIEVERRLARMKREGASAEFISSKRNEWWPAVARRYERRNSLARSIPVPDGAQNILKRLLAAVCSVSRVEPDSITGRRRTKGMTPVRRSFAWAACQMGYSLHEVAMFMRRPGSHSTVIFWRDGASLDERLVGQTAIDFVRRNTAPEQPAQTEQEAA